MTAVTCLSGKNMDLFPKIKILFEKRIIFHSLAKTLLLFHSAQKKDMDGDRHEDDGENGGEEDSDVISDDGDDDDVDDGPPDRRKRLRSSREQEFAELCKDRPQ
jgi:hypothetical protein